MLAMHIANQNSITDTLYALPTSSPGVITDCRYRLETPEHQWVWSQNKMLYLMTAEEFVKVWAISSKPCRFFVLHYSWYYWLKNLTWRLCRSLRLSSYKLKNTGWFTKNYKKNIRTIFLLFSFCALSFIVSKAPWFTIQFMGVFHATTLL